MKKVMALLLTLIMACSLCLTSCDMQGVLHFAAKGNIKSVIKYMFAPAGTYASKYSDKKEEPKSEETKDKAKVQEKNVLKASLADGQTFAIRLQSAK